MLAIRRMPSWLPAFVAPNVVGLLAALLRAGGAWDSPQFLNVAGRFAVYVNVTVVLALLIVRRLPQRSHRLPILLAISAMIGFVAAGSLIAQTLLAGLGLVSPRSFWNEYFDTLAVALPVALAFGCGAFAYHSVRGRLGEAQRKLQEKEIAEERVNKLIAQARLHALESRLHPHFLFNTLNSIIALIPGSSSEAEHALQRLARLLRTSLDNTRNALLPLREELAMIADYVAIERMRFAGELLYRTEVPEELLDVRVPPLSIQSLVENSLKHGILPQPAGGEVAVSACAVGDNLQVEVCDTGAGFSLAAIPAGHGLDNLVSRLDTIFGSRARLEVVRREGQTVVRMVLPRT